uniref:Alternative protein TXNL4B n=1 Tax=Homo sapiens TaxID=9606 RepID=L8E8E2_HUMAN|nr:alternative protein TXNL4B [Homo sapiens]
MMHGATTAILGPRGAQHHVKHRYAKKNKKSPISDVIELLHELWTCLPQTSVKE